MPPNFRIRPAFEVVRPVADIRPVQDRHHDDDRHNDNDAAKRDFEFHGAMPPQNALKEFKSGDNTRDCLNCQPHGPAGRLISRYRRASAPTPATARGQPPMVFNASAISSEVTSRRCVAKVQLKP